MTFRVGQKVCCIKDDWFNLKRQPIKGPVKGRVYTVTRVWSHQFPAINITLLDLAEIPKGWSARNFRPVVSRKTDISVFKALLNTNKVREEA